MWMSAGVRNPAERFSSRRDSTSRTGRSVRRESSVEITPVSPQPILEPNPPPMYSHNTRTWSSSSPNVAASSLRAL